MLHTSLCFDTRPVVLILAAGVLPIAAILGWIGRRSALFSSSRLMVIGPGAVPRIADFMQHPQQTTCVVTGVGPAGAVLSLLVGSALVSDKPTFQVPGFLRWPIVGNLVLR